MTVQLHQAAAAEGEFSSPSWGLACCDWKLECASRSSVCMCVHVGRLMFAAGKMAVNIFLGATSAPHLKKTKRNKTEKRKSVSWRVRWKSSRKIFPAFFSIQWTKNIAFLPSSSTRRTPGKICFSKWKVSNLKSYDLFANRKFDLPSQVVRRVRLA